MPRKSFIWLLVMVLSSLTAVLFVSAAPEEINLDVTWEQEPGTHISTSSTFGATVPDIARAPNSARLVIVYSHYRDPDGNARDPYYAVSDNDGDSWGVAAPIHSDAGTSARQVRVAVGGDGVVHATWVEIDGGNNYQLLYARRSGGTFDAPQVRSSAAFPFGLIADPEVHVVNNTTIDLVWTEKTSQQNPNIKYARSTDGGLTWPIGGNVADTAPSSFSPAVAIDQQGRLNVVWEENDLVKFAQGSQNGNAVSWTSPVVISEAAVNPQKPAILTDGNHLHVAYSEYVSDQEQYIFYTECSTACAAGGSWMSANNPVSGPRAEVNGIDPFVLDPAIGLGNGCVFVYFPSTDPFSGPPNSINEAVQGINSCAGWAAGARDMATSHQNRAIQPSLAVASNALHLAYEQVDGGTNRQIYYLRGVASARINLPVVLRP